MSWPIVKLGDVCDLQNGYAFKSSDYVEESNTLSCRMSNIRPGGVFNIDYNSRFLPDEFAEKYKQFLLKDGDVIIAMTDLADSPKILGVPTVVKTTGRNILLNQRVGKLVIRDTSIIHFPYLKLALNYPRVRDIYKKYAGGGLQINLGKSDLLSVEIPLPPLAEQKRIATILDKADAIRRKRKQAIKLADDYLRSVFLDMFGDPVTNPKGWEVQSLSSLCKKITDGTHHSPPITECGVPYVTAKHLKKTGLEFHKNPWYISEESHQAIYSRCNPELNDVLYIKDGATTGLAAINDYDFEFSMLSSLALLKPDYDKITSEFLCMFLNHPRTKLVLTANMAGAAITRLTLAKIKDVKVPLPDLATQKKFSETYISVRNFLEKVASSSDLANQEFNSLSQKAFAGEL
ncbi:restriction endonuclease subunit S [Shewanella baltica]|uniref:restriction endonuclease subunit S n=2 Tax=Shewanella TaxID=22 RepID=UPI00217E400C|nr:restriction endonuclease subunit S [Shewanella baltica]MCS6210431.1 restriction endonuclease subunit S [Shewanella baltica]